MNNYVYADGYGHISEGLNAEQIKTDETIHGALQFMKRSDGRVVRVDTRTDHPSINQDDQMQLVEFAYSKRESLVIEYRNSEICRQRSMTLRGWLKQNGFSHEIEMHKRKENLFFERIK